MSLQDLYQVLTQTQQKKEQLMQRATEQAAADHATIADIDRRIAMHPGALKTKI